MTLFSLHLIPLPVLLPLLAAPLCALWGNRAKSAWVWTAIISVATFAVSLLLFREMLMDGKPLSYAMGGWIPPLGIEYRVTLLTSFMLVLISGIGAFLMPYASKAVAVEIAEHKRSAFYCMYLLCLAGLQGMVLTNDIFNIYVFLEISSLATYTLIGMGKERRALLAAFEYLILGTIGATFYLLGVGLLYMATGTLNFSDLAARILSPDVGYTFPVIGGIILIVVGLLLKIAIFPLHVWLYNAYSYAPSFIASFLSATATKVGLFVLVRLVFELFGLRFAFGKVSLILLLETVFVPLACIGIIAASISAVYQQNIRRMLAYSSIANIGYILLGFSLGTEAGFAAGFVHMFNHALAKSGLFLVCGAVALRYQGATLEHFKGMGKQMPLTMLAFVLCGLSLIGTPLTAGFISKWALLVALFEKGWWPVLVLVLVSSLLAVAYIWRVIEVAYFREHPNAAPTRTEAPWPVLLSLWMLVAANIYFGFDTRFTLDVVAKSTVFLVGGVSQ